MRINILILFVLFFSLLFAQKQDSVIIEYLSLADTLYQKNKGKLHLDMDFDFTGLDKEEVKNLFCLIHGEKYLEFSRTMIKKGNETREKLNELHANGVYITDEIVRSLNYNHKIALIEIFMKKEFGEAFINILKNEYIVRVKILDIENNKSYSESSQEYIPSTLYRCKVEEVLRGDWKFQFGQLIDINQIIMLESIYLEKNCSYLLSIRDWLVLNDNPHLVITNFKGLRDEYFPIKDDYFYPTNNYFNLGDSIKWDTFNEIFKKTY